MWFLLYFHSRSFFFFEVYGYHRDLHLLTRSFPTRRSSDLGLAPAPPVIDLLVLSGGGDWGAFGAGVLKGWGRVSGPMARPEFDAVTGVSTGALIDRKSTRLNSSH